MCTSTQHSNQGVQTCTAILQVRLPVLRGSFCAGLLLECSGYQRPYPPLVIMIHSAWIIPGKKMSKVNSRLSQKSVSKVPLCMTTASGGTKIATIILHNLLWEPCRVKSPAVSPTLCACSLKPPIVCAYVCLSPFTMNKMSIHKHKTQCQYRRPKLARHLLGRVKMQMHRIQLFESKPWLRASSC